MRRITLLALLGVMGLVGPANAAAPFDDLYRPLDLPEVASGESCPVSPVDESVDWESTHIFGGSGIGPGPAYPGLGGSEGRFFVDDDERTNGFYGGKLFWYVDPSYLGPVLIRGRRIDRRDPLRFNHVDTRELRIRKDKTVTWDGQPEGSRGAPSGPLIRRAGCYAVQFDGTSFSYPVVFRASIRSFR